ncbi:MAG: hypothetical protein KAJ24_01030 [Candidatus Aenigmarchaeota archaeon]|nr:hypothetical protein [Candidatus Aenigmarchaeota archaeon]
MVKLDVDARLEAINKYIDTPKLEDIDGYNKGRILCGLEDQTVTPEELSEMTNQCFCGGGFDVPTTKRYLEELHEEGLVTLEEDGGYLRNF